MTHLTETPLPKLYGLRAHLKGAVRNPKLLDIQPNIEKYIARIDAELINRGILLKLIKYRL